jgi:hypothetical protein
MEKIIRNISCIVGNVSGALCANYRTHDVLYKEIDERVHTVFSRPFGYNEDKVNMRNDSVNISSDIKKAIFKAKKTI